MIEQPGAWYALMTVEGAGFREGRRVFGEFAAVETIGDEGIEAFAPTLRELVKPHRHAARRVPRYVPLIPGYCFARFVTPPPPSRIRRWREVIDIVRHGRDGPPYAIPERQIAALRLLDETDVAVIDTAGMPLAEPRHRLARPGDIVEHRGGAWEGLRAEVESVELKAARAEAVILVQLLGAQRRARVPLRELEVRERAKA